MTLESVSRSALPSMTTPPTAVSRFGKVDRSEPRTLRSSSAGGTHTVVAGFETGVVEQQEVDPIWIGHLLGVHRRQPRQGRGDVCLTDLLGLGIGIAFGCRQQRVGAHSFGHDRLGVLHRVSGASTE